MILTINAHREGYAPDQIASTMTVGELIEFLNNFDEDEKVYLSHDNGYTSVSYTHLTLPTILRV